MAYDTEINVLLIFRENRIKKKPGEKFERSDFMAFSETENSFAWFWVACHVRVASGVQVQCDLLRYCGYPLQPPATLGHMCGSKYNGTRGEN